MRSRACAAAIVLLLVSASGMSPLGTCSGWNASAEVREDCCHAAGHECEGADADACCARDEEARHTQPPGQSAILVSAASILVAIDQPVPIVGLKPSHTSPRSIVASNHTYLVISVILV